MEIESSWRRSLFGSVWFQRRQKDSSLTFDLWWPLDDLLWPLMNLSDFGWPEVLVQNSLYRQSHCLTVWKTGNALTTTLCSYRKGFVLAFFWPLFWVGGFGFRSKKILLKELHLISCQLSQEKTCLIGNGSLKWVIIWVIQYESQNMTH